MLYTNEFAMALKESIDGPHGYVIARDRKTGEILINKHNTIVQTGKEYLWSLFMKMQMDSFKADHQDAKIATPYDESLLQYYLSRAVFSERTEEVVYSDGTPITSGSIIAFELTFDNSSGLLKSPAAFSEYNGHRLISFSFLISGDRFDESTSPRSLSTLELQLGHNNEYELFSRIRFDTIPYTKDSDIEIVYYIYF